MLLDALHSILYAGLPVGIFSFLMVYYAYFKGYLSPSMSIKLAFANKGDDHKLSKKHKKQLQFLHSKWLTFGGGFYGLVALLTFMYIEIEQMVQWLLKATGFQYFLDLLTISTIINMFIESILNMIKAAIWFTYWPDVFDIGNGIVWILAAYIGYRAGAKLAQNYVLKKEIPN